MTIEEELLREAQMQTAILRAAHREALSELSASLRSNDTSAAIMEALRQKAGPLAARELTDGVTNSAKVSLRTVQARVSHLEEMGVLRRLGAGPNTSYELTGLLG